MTGTPSTRTPADTRTGPTASPCPRSGRCSRWPTGRRLSRSPAACLYTAALPLDAVGSMLGELVAHNGATVLQYCAGQGDERLRELICDVMALEGITGGSSDDVVITVGSQQALDLVSRIFLDPGDMVLAEGPSYVGALGTFAAAEATVLHVVLDEHGLVPAALEETLAGLAAEGRQAKFLYTVPNFHNPATYWRADQRRLQLVADREQERLLGLAGPGELRRHVVEGAARAGRARRSPRPGARVRLARGEAAASRPRRGRPGGGSRGRAARTERPRAPRRRAPRAAAPRRTAAVDARGASGAQQHERLVPRRAARRGSSRRRRRGRGPGRRGSPRRSCAPLRRAGTRDGSERLLQRALVLPREVLPVLREVAERRDGGALARREQVGLVADVGDRRVLHRAAGEDEPDRRA